MFFASIKEYSILKYINRYYHLIKITDCTYKVNDFTYIRREYCYFQICTSFNYNSTFCCQNAVPVDIKYVRD